MLKEGNVLHHRSEEQIDSASLHFVLDQLTSADVRRPATSEPPTSIRICTAADLRFKDADGSEWVSCSLVSF